MSKEEQQQCRVETRLWKSPADVVHLVTALHSSAQLAETHKSAGQGLADLAQNDAVSRKSNRNKYEHK